ncbi:MAG TPA: farnesyl diphosphate synthase [Tepidisphaeraceae bacterium]|nr:farnesyl diphosphate synthase [Tepidisphaeraceae bacterium]
MVNATAFDGVMNMADIPVTNALELLKADGERVGRYLQQVLAGRKSAPPRLLEAIEYSLVAGGKRLRPALVMECARVCSSAEQNRDGDGFLSALAAAGAIELIHTFSLVHDDLPAMDDDDLRRGRPTNHRVFGEAMAILAGDAMVTLAFELLATEATADVSPALIRELATAAGPEGMIGGQVLDMAGENHPLSLDELRRIHRMKTGALLTASCRLGATAANGGVAALEAMSSFGQHLGIAFQIVDDVLDVTSTPEQLGKRTNKDAGKGKNTYPALIGLDASKRAARDHLDAAIGALQEFGPRADRLKSLARFVVDRTT